MVSIIIIIIIIIIRAQWVWERWYFCKGLTLHWPHQPRYAVVQLEAPATHFPASKTVRA